MTEEPEKRSWVAWLLAMPIDFLRSTGEVTILGFRALLWAVRPPYRWGLILHSMRFVGIGSLFIISLTGTFTGAVFAFQSNEILKWFAASTLVGSLVSQSLARELGPVLGCLMLTSRACSAMATELGTMRVTEQIDALESMAVNPVQYLVVPRVVAGTLMAPVLCMLFNLFGMLGCYMVAVKGLQVDPGPYWHYIQMWTDPPDVIHGVVKSLFMGFVCSLIACYKGYTASRGAAGVGRATNEAVVLASVSIFVMDYFLTVLMISSGFTK
jgi:phospholipid/cholesterol/gamma-HCH transport system permease protein